MKNIWNEKGQALINAIITSGVIGIVSAAIFQNVLQAQNELKLPRLKAAQALAETQVRNLLLSPASFLDCGRSGLTCRLHPEAFAKSLNGFLVVNPQFEPTSGNFSASLRYNDENVNVKLIPIQFKVPSDVLMSAQFICPDERPVFRSYSSTGEPVCEALGLAQMRCPEGQYVSAVNPLTLAVTCQSFQTDISCGSNQLLGAMSWDGVGQFSFQCQNRAGVFEFAEFSPSSVVVRSGTVAGVDGGDLPPRPLPSPNPVITYVDCDGSGGGWSDWSECPCGGGTQARTCLRPSPQNCNDLDGGNSTRACAAPPCARRDGGWSEWSSCNALCGQPQASTRTCTEPTPSVSPPGRLCVNSQGSEDSSGIETRSCPVLPCNCDDPPTSVPNCPLNYTGSYNYVRKANPRPPNDCYELRNDCRPPPPPPVCDPQVGRPVLASCGTGFTDERQVVFVDRHPLCWRVDGDCVPEVVTPTSTTLGGSGIWRPYSSEDTGCTSNNCSLYLNKPCNPTGSQIMCCSIAPIRKRWLECR